MKRLFLLFFGLFSVYSFGCSCITQQLSEKFINSDFIAKVKIMNLYPDAENKNIHNVDVEIIELFKGEKVKKMKIYSEQYSSCAFFTPKGTTWLVFASSLEDTFIFGYCSDSMRFGKYDSGKAKLNYENKIALI